MVLKYIVYFNETVFGISHNDKKNEVVLGGNCKFRRIYELVITDYFGRQLGEVKNHIDRNKIRYTLSFVNGHELFVIQCRMEDHHFIFNQVSRLDRIRR